MAYNVPDDWDNYWNTCPRDGYRYHASEGYCPVCELEEDADQEYEDDSDPDLYPNYDDYDNGYDF